MTNPWLGVLLALCLGAFRFGVYPGLYRRWVGWRNFRRLRRLAATIKDPEERAKMEADINELQAAFDAGEDDES